jgi:hypothetical protein
MCECPSAVVFGANIILYKKDKEPFEKKDKLYLKVYKSIERKTINQLD